MGQVFSWRDQRKWGELSVGKVSSRGNWQLTVDRLSIEKRRRLFQLHCGAGKKIERTHHASENVEVELLPRIYKDSARVYGWDEKTEDNGLSTTDDKDFDLTFGQWGTYQCFNANRNWEDELI